MKESINLRLLYNPGQTFSYAGQCIIVDPRLSMVIVVTSDLNADAAEADARESAILDIVSKHVLSAAHP